MVVFTFRFFQAVSIALVALALEGCYFSGKQFDLLMNPPHESTLNGRYEGLLLTLNVPEDRGLVGEVRELGFKNIRNYRGYSELPAGHWVYVAPDYYIWAIKRGERSVAVANSQTVAPLMPAKQSERSFEILSAEPKAPQVKRVLVAPTAPVEAVQVQAPRQTPPVRHEYTSQPSRRYTISEGQLAQDPATSVFKTRSRPERARAQLRDPIEANTSTPEEKWQPF